MAATSSRTERPGASIPSSLVIRTRLAAGSSTLILFSLHESPARLTPSRSCELPGFVPKNAAQYFASCQFWQFVPEFDQARDFEGGQMFPAISYQRLLGRRLTFFENDIRHRSFATV